ncbi:hypothetical protein [Promicromonospora aerolata]|uniref:Uncharacterized protein n=1 Tax=Promicromonospora aerolata TaxID=195749 RepID=A0ABW4VFA7_9MICO
MKRVFMVFVVAAGLSLGGGMSAQAGETSGTGAPVPGGANASSACAYSGLDLPDDQEPQPPEFDDDFVTDGHVQTYGKWVSHGFKGVVPSPGEACRGNLGSEG